MANAVLSRREMETERKKNAENFRFYGFIINDALKFRLDTSGSIFYHSAG